MIEREPGKIQVKWGDMSFNAKYYDPEIYIRWISGFDDDELNILFMKKEQAKNLIRLLQQTIQDMEEYEKRIQQIMKETDFTSLYQHFEEKYNPYPVQMSREEAFAKALRDGLIEPEVYDAAKRYYKGLWNYVGD